MGMKTGSVRVRCGARIVDRNLGPNKKCNKCWTCNSDAFSSLVRQSLLLDLRIEMDCYIAYKQVIGGADHCPALWNSPSSYTLWCLHLMSSWGLLLFSLFILVLRVNMWGYRDGVGLAKLTFSFLFPYFGDPTSCTLSKKHTFPTSWVTAWDNETHFCDALGSPYFTFLLFFLWSWFCLPM